MCCTMYSKPYIPLGVERFERVGRRSTPVHYETYINMGECAICQSPIPTWKVLVELPCTHVFYWGCLAKYAITRLKATRAAVECPLCRRPLTVRFRTERDVGIEGAQYPVVLQTIEDAFGNCHTYGIVDARGACYAMVDALGPRAKLARLRPPYRVATVRVNP